ncbi:MAG: hypothetical protein H7320_00395 [Ferruginibacter sp.]|nr:hypothetical protein [Ferruginibacter sp.]
MKQGAARMKARRNIDPIRCNKCDTGFYASSVEMGTLICAFPALRSPTITCGCNYRFTTLQSWRRF